MNKLSLQDLIFQALIGAIYVVLVLVLIPISYGGVQFRVAEALLVLIFFSRKNTIGILVGTFVANLFSPDGFGIIDAIFGTLASGLALFLMSIFRKKVSLALIFPVLINAVYVAILLNVMLDLPLWINMLTVGLGEAVVVYLLGFPLFVTLNKNKRFLSLFD